MKALVTGASGFIGAQTCLALLEAGWEVGALVRPGAVPPRLAPFADRLRLIPGSIYDMQAATPILNDWQPDACLHLAWYVEPGKCLEAPENLRALRASFDLMQTLIAAGCRHIVTAGTCAEYDTDQGWLKEDSPTRPETLYAAAKLSLNLIGQQIAKSARIVHTHARIFYVYGPGEDARRVVPGLITTLAKGQPFKATKGEQMRDYLHVEDVASALAVILQERAEGVINIASGTPVSIRQMMETLGGLMNRPDLIHFGAIPCRAWDPCFICGDNTRLRALGWNPRYTLAHGLCQTVDWWRGDMS